MIPVFIVLAVVVLYFLGTYNSFVVAKTRIKASIQEIGNQLKRQADLIPNLVSSVKGYMRHEKTIFADLTEARKMVSSVADSDNAQKLINVSAKMEKALSPIMAVFESTPELKAAGPTTQLMEELRDTADKLMYSRRTLIDLTADYNIKVATFPSSVVAGVFKFSAEKGLEMPEGGKVVTVSEKETESPKVSLE